MNQGFSDVLGTTHSLRAASDNIQIIDDMITGIHAAQGRSPALTEAQKMQAQLGLIEQLGDMIAARRSHRANNRMLAITDALLDKLNPM